MVQNSIEAFSVREKIMSENARGSMVARRLLWLLGKADLSKYAAILGGQSNCIVGAAGTNSFYGFIGAGVNNCITNSCSAAILGGQNNKANHDFAGIFGCNVTSGMGCAFHANNFVAQNIPLGPGILPTGSFYYLTGVPLPAPWNTCKFVFVV